VSGGGNNDDKDNNELVLFFLGYSPNLCDVGLPKRSREDKFGAPERGGRVRAGERRRSDVASTVRRLVYVPRILARVGACH
jgi:hypothetical protein